MPRRTTDGTPIKTDTKTFVKLMTKREAIQKTITRQQRKLAKVDSQLGKFADWLKTLTTNKNG